MKQGKTVGIYFPADIHKKAAEIKEICGKVGKALGLRGRAPIGRLLEAIASGELVVSREDEERYTIDEVCELLKSK